MAVQVHGDLNRAVVLLDTLSYISLMFPAMSTKSAPPIKQQIGARVNQDLITEIRVLAARQRRRFNEVIEESLKDVLKKYREKGK
jgi:hypothetical protein